MFRFLRLFIREMLSPIGRFRFFSYLIRNLPGDSGFAIRKKVMSKWFAKVGNNIVINEGVIIRNIEKMEVGNNVYLGVDNYYQAAAGLKVGDDTMFGPGVKIWTQNHKFDDPDKPIAQQGYDFKPVVIGKNVWVGANAFIMPGATIGDGCIISAMSVVGAKKIPPYSILAGNPARLIGKRQKQEEPPEENKDQSNLKTE